MIILLGVLTMWQPCHFDMYEKVLVKASMVMCGVLLNAHNFTCCAICLADVKG